MQIELGLGFALNLFLGGLLGLFVRGLYNRYGSVASDGEEFANMFPLFILATITVIVVVQLSLALSLGLIGALTIVRFRGPIKGPQELVYLMFCVSIGLALGAGQPMLAVVAASTVALFIVFGGAANRRAYERNLVVTVTGDAKHFFPRDAVSGLERLRKIRPFTLQRLDQGGGGVEARGIVTIESAEDADNVLAELRKELSDLRVSSVDVDDVQAAGGKGKNSQHPDTASRVSGGPFEIIDALQTPGSVDLFRREVKFALTNTDSAKVRSILEVNCQRIMHAGPVSTIHTIYFDDARLSACHENLDGVPRRAKVRLRWYDQGDEEGRLFFEIKRRVDSVVHKQRLAIHSKLPLVKMTYGEILAELQRVLPAAASAMLMARSEAVVISEYRREYFGAPGSEARITLDERIVSYSQMGSTRPSKRFGVRDDQLVILEAKIPPQRGGELRELLHPLEPHVTKSSKYVRACLRLGLLYGTAATAGGPSLTSDAPDSSST